MIPVVCVLEWILHNKHYSGKIKIAVIVVVVGVGVCTVTDVKVNAQGFICACVAVLSTSLQQIVSSFSIYISLFCLKAFLIYPFNLLMIIVHLQNSKKPSKLIAVYFYWM